MEWQKTYGRPEYDVAYLIQQTADGGFIVAGHTGSFGTGYCNFWVLKLNSSGDVQWQKTYGGSEFDIDVAYSIQQTSDGGFIIAGHANSSGAGYDFWVLKLNSSGDVVWQKKYGGSSDEYARSIQQSNDSGFIVAGYTESFGVGGDFLLLKLNSSGDIEWQKTYGGSGRDEAYSVLQTCDGGFAVAGHTDSFGAGLYDFWVMKIDRYGRISPKPGTNMTTYDTNCAVNATNASVSLTSCTVSTQPFVQTTTSVSGQDTNCTVVIQADPYYESEGAPDMMTLSLMALPTAAVIIVVTIAVIRKRKKRKEQAP